MEALAAKLSSFLKHILLWREYFNSLRRDEEEHAIDLSKMQSSGLNVEEMQYTYLK